MYSKALSRLSACLYSLGKAFTWWSFSLQRQLILLAGLGEEVLNLLREGFDVSQFTLLILLCRRVSSLFGLYLQSVTLKGRSWTQNWTPCFHDDSPPEHPGVLLGAWAGGVLAEGAQVKLLMTIRSLSCALGLSRARLGTPGSCRSPASGEHCWGKSSRAFGLSWGKINTWVTTGVSDLEPWPREAFGLGSMTCGFGDIISPQRDELAGLKACMRCLVELELPQQPWQRLTLQLEHERAAACGSPGK